MNNYSVRIYEENSTKLSTINTLIQTTEFIFITFFILEFIFKIIGMGFIFGKDTYLKDG